MEIIQGNKLIAEFMGWTYYGWNDPRLIKQDGEGRYESGWKKRPNAPMISKLRHHDYLCGNHKNLAYDVSWNWLMPVIEKIRDIQGLVDLEMTIKVIISTISPTRVTLRFNSVKELWLCTVEYIQRYNENK